MKVTLIASTTLVPKHSSMESGPPWKIGQWLSLTEDAPDDAEWLTEFAGRACYESWHRPNPQTAENRDYIRSIIAKQHFSVLEHASATFYIENVSRTCTHELVRHRHLSYSQRSQRYVDESSSGVVVPDAMVRVRDARLGNDQTVQEAATELENTSHELYQNLVRIMVEAGIPRKEARGAARGWLLQNTETNLVVTGNHRAWREFISKRWHAAADPEIRTLAGMILRDLRDIAPAIYADFDPYRPIGMPTDDA